MKDDEQDNTRKRRATIQMFQSLQAALPESVVHEREAVQFVKAAWRQWGGHGSSLEDIIQAGCLEDLAAQVDSWSKMGQKRDTLSFMYILIVKCRSFLQQPFTKKGQKRDTLSLTIGGYEL
jgi:hypothetical protein